MEHLWAPGAWPISIRAAERARLHLLRQATGRPRRRELVLYRGERCFVLMNLFPYNNGHLMIAPYAHVPDIERLDAETLTEMMLTAQKSLAALRAAMRPDGFNMGINQGTVAGAGIADHVHFHVVPRWNGDTNFMPVLADTKVMPDYLRNTYRQLKPHFA